MGVTTHIDTRINGRQGVTLNFRMYISDCPECGVLFGITEDFEDERRRDCRTFYCPNGHQMSWSESEAQKERKKAQRLQREKEQAEALAARRLAALDQEKAERKVAERQAAAYKGQATRARKRAAAALCPVEGCGRSFVQVRRHLTSKHPDYVAPEPTA